MLEPIWHQWFMVPSLLTWPWTAKHVITLQEQHVPNAINKKKTWNHNQSTYPKWPAKRIVYNLTSSCSNIFQNNLRSSSKGLRACRRKTGFSNKSLLAGRRWASRASSAARTRRRGPMRPPASKGNQLEASWQRWRKPWWNTKGKKRNRYSIQQET